MSNSVTKKPAKAPAATKSALQAANKGQAIRLLVKENPKRGESASRFAYYRDGITVDDYVARCVKAGKPSSLARADLRWDTARKFIAIG
jgi:hypothetical protein